MEVVAGVGGRAPGSVGAAACGKAVLSGSRVADQADCSRVAGQTVRSMRAEARFGYSMGLLDLQGHHHEGYSSLAPSHSTSPHDCSRVGTEAELEWGQTVEVAEGSMMAFHAGDQTSQVLRMEYQRRQKDWSQVVSSENHHNHPEVGLSLEASHRAEQSERTGSLL